MHDTPKTKENSQLIAGVSTIVFAAALLIGTVVCMRRCVAEWPEPPTVGTTDTLGTLPNFSVGPTLAPNPYGPGDFAYDNGYLTCLSGESLLGVDVSEYQGEINWDQVAAAGVEFAMIRIGFRGWGSQGEIQADAYAEANLKGAAEAGLKIGVYFFSQAISEEEAREEARYVLDMLESVEVDMPVVFDWETVPAEDARTAGVTGDQLNTYAMAFCSEIAAAGYDPMVYFNQDFSKRMYDLKNLQEAGFGFWLAMYSDSMTYSHKLTMWQYTSGGSVPGIYGNVDLNLYFTYE